jgi:alkylation response protein AidB-like acyl-CoA dehydrogenase
MHFDLNDEQQALADSVAKQAPKLFPFQAAGRRAAAFDRAKWQEIADLGWLSLTLPEAADGLGLALQDAAPIFDALGAHLALLPLVPHLEAAALLAGESQTSQTSHTALLQAMGQGSSLVVPALREAGADAGALPRQTRAIPQGDGDGDGVQLQGEKRAVAWGAEASHWVVSAALPDGQPSLWLLPANAAGVQVHAYAGIDDKRLANLQFDGVRLPLAACIAQGQGAKDLLADAQAVAIAATCAEAAGAMAALHALTLDYVKTRKQFGKTIGSFQAVQHRLADMLVKVELAKSLAAVALQVAADRKGRSGLLHAAKVQASQSARYVSEQAVQLHGGIGLTNECQVSHYTRRLLALEKLQGDAQQHLGALVHLPEALV